MITWEESDFPLLSKAVNLFEPKPKSYLALVTRVVVRQLFFLTARIPDRWFSDILSIAIHYCGRSEGARKSGCTLSEFDRPEDSSFLLPARSISAANRNLLL